MPFMDGLEVMAAARALRPTLPILAISGIRDYRVKVESFAHPPVLFMAKPFLLDALLATLREALQAEPEAQDRVLARPGKDEEQDRKEVAGRRRTQAWRKTR